MENSQRTVQALDTKKNKYLISILIIGGLLIASALVILVLISADNLNPTNVSKNNNTSNENVVSFNNLSNENVVSTDNTSNENGAIVPIQQENLNTNLTYSSAYFLLDFEYPPLLGELTTKANRTDNPDTNSLFCFAENITFGESKITMRLTKGAPECHGAIGYSLLLSEEVVISKDNKEYKLIVVNSNNTSQIDVFANYGSNKDMIRNVQFKFNGTGKDEVDNAVLEIKNMIKSSVFNDGKMKSEAI